MCRDLAFVERHDPVVQSRGAAQSALESGNGARFCCSSSCKRRPIARISSAGAPVSSSSTLRSRRNGIGAEGEDFSCVSRAIRPVPFRRQNLGRRRSGDRPGEREALPSQVRQGRLERRQLGRQLLGGLLIALPLEEDGAVFQGIAHALQ